MWFMRLTGFLCNGFLHARYFNSQHATQRMVAPQRRKMACQAGDLVERQRRQKYLSRSSSLQRSQSLMGAWYLVINVGPLWNSQWPQTHQLNMGPGSQGEAEQNVKLSNLLIFLRFLLKLFIPTYPQCKGLPPLAFQGIQKKPQQQFQQWNTHYFNATHHAVRQFQVSGQCVLCKTEMFFSCSSGTLLAKGDNAAVCDCGFESRIVEVRIQVLCNSEPGSTCK